MRKFQTAYCLYGSRMYGMEGELFPPHAGDLAGVQRAIREQIGNDWRIKDLKVKEVPAAEGFHGPQTIYHFEDSAVVVIYE